MLMSHTHRIFFGGERGAERVRLCGSKKVCGVTVIDGWLWVQRLHSDMSG